MSLSFLVQSLCSEQKKTHLRGGGEGCGGEDVNKLIGREKKLAQITNCPYVLQAHSSIFQFVCTFSRSISETLLPPPKLWPHRIEAVCLFSKSRNTPTDLLCGYFHNDNIY